MTNKNINNINQENNLNDSFDSNISKKKYIYDDRRRNGIVKFNGMKNKFDLNKENEPKHCIYLRTQNDFNSVVEGKIFSWKIKILSNSKFIGVGLADKYIVIKNNFKFFRKKNNFYNGIFCLYNIYKPEIKDYKVYPWSPRNTELNENFINFPCFNKGLEITMIYNTVNKCLEFFTNLKNKESYKMENVISIGEIGRNTFTPCVIFFYPGDEVQISNLEAKNII